LRVAAARALDRSRTRNCGPAAHVARATEMRTVQAVASTMDMAPAVATMAASMTSTMPSTVASATLAERHARQQGRQNKNGNSNGWFGHGTLPAPLAHRSRHHNDANGNRKFHRRGSGARIRQ